MKPTAALFLLLVLAGCGGTASAPPTSGGATPATPTGGNNGGSTAPATTAGTVAIAAGQTVVGADITVSAPKSSTAPNAQNLGVAALSGSGSAYNTGDIIHRGATGRVLLFGPGLTGDMQVIIRGPSDIAISSITAIKSTDNTPGISFIAAVSANAMLGARTVVLQNAQGDVTTFTGGLEVVP